MCEANVYLIEENGDQSLVLESVDKIIPQAEGLFLENIFGQRKTIKASIFEMELVNHKILLKK